jgi:hypothetical protein
MLNSVPFTTDSLLDNQSRGKPPADINVFPGIHAQALVKLAAILILRNYLRRSPAKTYCMYKKLSMNETAALKTNAWFGGAAKRS